MNSKLLIAIFMIVFTGLADAQNINVSIEPSVPAAHQPFEILLDVPTSICESKNPSWVLEGQTLIINLHSEYVCGPNINPFPINESFNFAISGLQAGSYELVFYGNRESFPQFAISLGFLSIAAAVPIGGPTAAPLMALMFVLTSCGFFRRQRSLRGRRPGHQATTNVLEKPFLETSKALVEISLSHAKNSA